MSTTQQYDVLVIGSGAAGLGTALRLPPDLRVAVLAKAPLEESSTHYAQGGISAVLDATDSLETHVRDTLVAGAGLCREDVVREVVAGGPAQVRWLLELGVPFTRRGDGAGLHLTREGGHTHRRVAHADDATGRAVSERLIEAARAAANVTLVEGAIAVDLVTRASGATRRCLGAYVLDRDSGRVRAIAARATVLATGGAGKVYLYTSNPDVATGDGIAMAWRAGCRVGNMEFIQFHPTCLYHPQAKSFLLTEALRGEGAVLRLPDGTRFMPRHDPRGELAPRDVVARAIDQEMKRLGLECVYLDISHRPAEFIRQHFPTVYERCLQFGFDLTAGPVPVVPAAHYLCGGVLTDLRARTDLEALYAVGEVACTGLHGANRMASNSLLECLVLGERAARDIAATIARWRAPGEVAAWDESRVTDSDEEVVVAHNWDELRRFMWDYVGIARTTRRLRRALHRVELLRSEVNEYYGNFRVTADLIELRNLLAVAELVIHSALLRTESRGLHYTRDFPEPADPPRESVLRRLATGEREQTLVGLDTPRLMEWNDAAT